MEYRSDDLKHFNRLYIEDPDPIPPSKVGETFVSLAGEAEKVDTGQESDQEPDQK